MIFTHNYRRDIDGLRAIAILAVILFHLDATWLKGGFLGVDIFFVISGFVITKGIISKIKENNFSLADFYFRRCKRILPVLFLLIIICILIAFFTWPPAYYERFLKSVKYASLQISNFLFARKINYFDEGSDAELLLHTWSLAVEEQFYLLWPLAIIAAFKINNYWKIITPVRVLILIFIISFICGNIIDIYDSNLAYYMFYTRAWEFCLGALAIYCQPWLKNIKYNNLIATLAIIIIFISLLFFSINTIPFGILFLLPTLATAILIALENSYINKILSIKIFVLIGLISYSLYLWHWPLIVLFKTINLGELNLYHIFSILILTFILAILSYKYIEKPARNIKKLPLFFPLNKLSLSWKVISLSLLIMISLASFRGILLPFKDHMSRLQVFLGSKESFQLAMDMEQKKKLKIEIVSNKMTSFVFKDKKKKINTPICSFDGIGEKLDFSFKPILNCLKQNPSEKKFLIIGDSHAQDMHLLLKDKFPKEKFIQLHHFGCTPFIKQPGRLNCFPRFEEFINEHLNTLNIKGIIFAFSYGETYIPNIEKIMNLLLDKNHKIWIFGPSPVFKAHLRDVVLFQNLHGNKLKTANVNHLRYYDTAKFNAKLKQVQKNYLAQGLNITFIDRWPALSDQGRALLHVPGSNLPMYIDEQHFTLEGLDYLKDKLTFTLVK